MKWCELADGRCGRGYPGECSKKDVTWRDDIYCKYEFALMTWVAGSFTIRVCITTILLTSVNSSKTSSSLTSSSETVACRSYNRKKCLLQKKIWLRQETARKYLKNNSSEFDVGEKNDKSYLLFWSYLGLFFFKY